jgi:hypothetical protein
MDLWKCETDENLELTLCKQCCSFLYESGVENRDHASEGLYSHYAGWLDQSSYSVFLEMHQFPLASVAS